MIMNPVLMLNCFCWRLLVEAISICTAPMRHKVRRCLFIVVTNDVVFPMAANVEKNVVKITSLYIG